MMPKSTWLPPILGLFLAATLIWTVPVFAQLQKGGLLNSNNQGSGTSSGGGFGSSSLIKKSPSSSEGSEDLFGSKTPDQEKNPAPAAQNIHTLSKPHDQPQSQTPGGTIIP
jgi:hypothetical protein